MKKKEGSPRRNREQGEPYTVTKPRSRFTQKGVGHITILTPGRDYLLPGEEELGRGMYTTGAHVKVWPKTKNSILMHHGKEIQRRQGHHKSHKKISYGQPHCIDIDRVKTSKPLLQKLQICQLLPSPSRQEVSQVSGW